MQKYTKRAGRAGLRAEGKEPEAQSAPFRPSGTFPRYAGEGKARRRQFWNPSPATQGKGKRGDASSGILPPLRRGRESAETQVLESFPRYAGEGKARRGKFWNPSPATQGKGKRGEASSGILPPLRRGRESAERQVLE